MDSEVLILQAPKLPPDKEARSRSLFKPSGFMSFGPFHPGSDVLNLGTGDQAFI